MNNERLRYLYQRYLDKSLTGEEDREWKAALADPALDDELQELIGNTWDHPDVRALKMDREKAMKVYRYIVSRPRRRRRVKLSWPRLAAAAVILVAACTGAWFFLRSPAEDLPSGITTVQDIRPGGNYATLTLADGREVELSKAQPGIVIGDAIVYTDGTIALDPETGQSRGDYMLRTPKGGQYLVQLPDGTKVWLNSASSITFPAVFGGASRRVRVTGECYFEVEHDRSKPFYVDINNQMEVKVLGTRFNIAAYPEAETVVTTLLEGSVRANSLINDGQGTGRQLVPGQQVRLVTAGEEAGSMQVKKLEKPGSAIAWKNGLFSFRNADITEIMRQLSRWYDIDVKYRGPKPSVRITGEVPRSLNLGDLLELLKLSNIKMETHGKNVVISN